MDFGDSSQSIDPATLILPAAFIAYALVCGGFAGRIWQDKGGANWKGFLIGFFFGVLGIIFVGFATPRAGVYKRECPWCFELMYNEAVICPHCQRESEESPESGVSP